MTIKLPKYIDPIKLADRETKLSGNLSIKDLPRLKELLVDQNGDIAVDLELGRDQEGYYFIRGKAAGILHLQCQRCLEGMDYPLAITISLSPVMSDASAKGLPSRYEPIFIEDDSIVISTLIEDEIMIALPMIPKHDVADCKKMD
jgi:uncharacterized protein